MNESIEERLHSAIWTFHNAVQRRDGVENRLRRGEVDADLYHRTLSASEAVVQARIALYRLLMSEGWTPPPAVIRDLEFDDSILHEQADH